MAQRYPVSNVACDSTSSQQKYLPQPLSQPASPRIQQFSNTNVPAQQRVVYTPPPQMSSVAGSSPMRSSLLSTSTHQINPMPGYSPLRSSLLCTPPQQSPAPGYGPYRASVPSTPPSQMSPAPVPGSGPMRPNSPYSNIRRQGPTMLFPPGNRIADQHLPVHQQQQQLGGYFSYVKKRNLDDKCIPEKVCKLDYEDKLPAQLYLKSLLYEKKFDAILTRKGFEIHDALKQPIKRNRKLRIFISTTFHPAKEATEIQDSTDASWELRITGHVLNDNNEIDNKIKRKFSSFFKSLEIALQTDLYGSDNFIQWHRQPNQKENDGFDVRRPGDTNVPCRLAFLLDCQPPKFKLDRQLARLLGIHTQTKSVIHSAFWQYIKKHQLQDRYEPEYINFDVNLQRIFGCRRIKFNEIPRLLVLPNRFLYPPDPIIIHHMIDVESQEIKRVTSYDIDIEMDEVELKAQMHKFILKSNQREIQSLDQIICDYVKQIKQTEVKRQFFLSFANDPQQFVKNWVKSQTRDLKVVTDVVGNPEKERRVEFYDQPWLTEAISHYLYKKYQQEQADFISSI